MKLTFDVWTNAKGELHMTCEDPRLEKGINIRGKDHLESTRVLINALVAEDERPYAAEVYVPGTWCVRDRRRGLVVRDGKDEVEAFATKEDADARAEELATAVNS